MATGVDLTRRALLQVSAAAAALRITPGRAAADPAAFHVDDFAIVGIYDVDWLLDPPYVRLLDTIAASPGAVRGVRVFGALSSGTRERVNPEGSGTVWPAPDRPMDFTPTLRALDALVERDLVPFLPLAFFPAAISPSPIEPPDDFALWQRLVRAFLDAAVERYGADRVAGWWFEVWNEPNMPPFWRGSFDRYLDLYRATSAAVVATGHRVRLGGPAIAYHDEGPELIERFATFLAADPEMRCDFVSFHRKGIWGPHEAEPLLARSVDAAQRTADALLRLAPARAPGLWIVNDEADMKVGFDTPYEPRMTEQFPSYLAAQAVEYARLTSRYAGHGMRFVASSDNANQHLVQAPFDGRRSLMTPLSARLDDLVKLPVWHFYEMLRVLGPRLAEPPTADDGLYKLVTEGDGGVAALFTLYAVPAPAERVVDVVLPVPWPRVNVVQFGITDWVANVYARAGRQMSKAPPAEAAFDLRSAAELESIWSTNEATRDGTVRQRLRLGPYSTIVVWITPYRLDPPAAPRWLPPVVDSGDVVLRWTPGTEPDLYGYELRQRIGDGPAEGIAPTLRGAAWVDAAAATVRPLWYVQGDPRINEVRPRPTGPHVYGVQAVSTSKIASPIAWSAPVTL